MSYKSRKQQAYFHVRLKELAKRWDKETYKGKGGGEANKRKWASLPERVRRRKRS